MERGGSGPEPGAGPDGDDALVLRLPAGIGAVRRAESAVLRLAARRVEARRRPSRLGLRTAVREAVANAVRHGGSGRGPLLEAAVERAPRPGRLRVTVAQDGPLETPSEAGDPRRGAAGRGLLLVRRLVDEVRFDGPRRRVTLWFDLGDDG